MTKTSVAFKYRKAIVAPKVSSNTAEEYLLKGLVINLASLGFILTKDAYEALTKGSFADASRIYKELISAIKEAVGDHVRHRPMYPNFPKQVADTPELELYFNAILHYWSFGRWLPEFEKVARPKKNEPIKLKEIRLISEDDFSSIASSLLSSRDSISEADKETIKWFFENENVNIPQEIPHKEILSFVAGILYGSKIFVDVLAKANTATDLLRIVTAISGGDVSLASNTKFKSLSRPVRRMLISRLEEVINEEDIKRHQNKWIHLFHSLHVGESKATKVKRIASIIRSGKTIRSFNSDVEDYIKENKVTHAVDLLMTRPSEFIRRLDHLLRKSPESSEYVLKVLEETMKSVPTRILVQLYGHFDGRNRTDFRVVMNKSASQKAFILNNTEAYSAVSTETCDKILSLIRTNLTTRFKLLPPLGTTYIDPVLKECPVPSQQRSASNGLFSIARGTKIPFSSDKDTLRFFVYWVGRDIDLSASLWDENSHQTRNRK